MDDPNQHLFLWRNRKKYNMELSLPSYDLKRYMGERGKWGAAESGFLFNIPFIYLFICASNGTCEQFPEPPCSTDTNKPVV